MLAQRIGESVRAVVAADEVEVTDVGGGQGGAENLSAGSRDRTWREARVDVGVVGRIEAQVGAGEVAVVAAGALEGVDRGGVALERHPDSQPVVEDGGDERELRVAPGLPLNDGCQRDRLACRQPALRRPRPQLGVEDHPEAGHHGGDEVVDGGGARKRVGLRKEVALQVRGVGVEVGDQLDPACGGGEVLRGGEPPFIDDRPHLGQRQALGEGDRLQMDAAGGDLPQRRGG